MKNLNKITKDQLATDYQNFIKNACYKESVRFKGLISHIPLEDFFQDAWAAIMGGYGSVDPAFSELKKELVILNTQKDIIKSKRGSTKKIDKLILNLKSGVREDGSEGIGFDPSMSALKTWLINVVHSVALQYARNKKRMKRDGLEIPLEYCFDHVGQDSDEMSNIYSKNLMIDNWLVNHPAWTPAHLLSSTEPKHKRAKFGAKVVNEALQKIPLKSEMILKEVFFKNQSLDNIANSLGLKRDYLDKIYKEALEQFKEALHNAKTKARLCSQTQTQ